MLELTKGEKNRTHTDRNTSRNDLPKIRAMNLEPLHHLKHFIPKLEGVLHTNRPAFIETIFLKGNKNLIISSFGFSPTTDEIKLIPNIDEMYDGKRKFESHKEISVAKDICWPNEITVIDKKLFGTEGFLVAGGFMLKPYTCGEVSFVDADTLKKTKISQDKRNWFYHKAIPFDLSRDGRPGILTSRCNKQLLSLTPSCGELVWFEKPDRKGQPFKEHVLAKGPDVYFTIADLNGDGKNEIIATDFFHNKIYLLYEDNGKFQKKEIDTSIKKPFDVALVDMNRDGKPELLVTNHTNNGSVYVYEVPEDIRNGAWQRRELIGNIKTRLPIPSEGAPGSAFCFYPKKGYSGKPYVVVSGDGAGKAILLIPKRPFDPMNWEYEQQIFCQENCTIGKIKVDYDAEGVARLYVPLYEKNKILCFSMENQSNSPQRAFKYSGI